MAREPLLLLVRALEVGCIGCAAIGVSLASGCEADSAANAPPPSALSSARPATPPSGFAVAAPPEARAAAVVREGATIARTPEDDALFIADEDASAIHAVSLPLGKSPRIVSTSLGGRPAALVVSRGRILATIREIDGKGALVELARKADAPLELVEVSRVHVPGDAWGIALSPDETLALVTSAWTASVSAIDLATSKVLWSTPVAREPRGVTVMPGGDTAYVSPRRERGDAHRRLRSAAPKVQRIKLPAAPLRSPDGVQLSASLGYVALASTSGDRVRFPRHALGALGVDAWFGVATVDTLWTADDSPLAPARGSGPVLEDSVAALRGRLVALHARRAVRHTGVADRRERRSDGQDLPPVSRRPKGARRLPEDAMRTVWLSRPLARGAGGIALLGTAAVVFGSLAAPGVAAPTASAAPAASAARIDPPTPLPLLASMAFPTEATAMPKGKEWSQATEVALTSGAAPGCRAYVLREWLKINCHGQENTGVIRQLAGSQTGVAVWVTPGVSVDHYVQPGDTAEIIFPVRRGDRRARDAGAKLGRAMEPRIAAAATKACADTKDCDRVLMLLDKYLFAPEVLVPLRGAAGVVLADACLDGECTCGEAALDLPETDARRLDLARLGCDAGEADGCYAVGRALEEGWGIDKDLDAAVAAYERACPPYAGRRDWQGAGDVEERSKRACDRLAAGYESGDLVAKDAGRAMFYARLACTEAGSETFHGGCVRVARLLVEAGIQGSHSDSDEWNAFGPLGGAADNECQRPSVAAACAEYKKVREAHF